MVARQIPVSRITPAQRREFQRAYEVTGQLLMANRDDEALPLSRQCVSADPDNRLYVKRLLMTLERVHPLDLAPGSYSARISCWFGLRQLRKLHGSEDWQATFEVGLTMIGETQHKLAQSRMEIELLMAAACRESQCFEGELAWLEGARQCLDAVSNSQPIKTTKVQPLQAEIVRRLSDSYLRHGDLAGAEALRNARRNTPKEEIAVALASEEQIADVQRLTQAIADSPEVVDGYLQLAEYYLRNDALFDAEGTLQQARYVEPSPQVTARLEDVQIAIAEARVQEARAQLNANPSPENSPAAAAVARLVNERLRIECEIHRSRCARDANDAESRLQLAVCLKELGNFIEAQRELEEFSWPAHLQSQADTELAECRAQRS